MIRIHLLLSLAAVLASGEPLVCRGFDAATALRAVVSVGGRLVRLDPALEQRRVWFALPGSGPHTARQALAHALDCWWTSPANGQLTRSRRLSAASAEVRSFPPLPHTPVGSEALLRRILDPWLEGDGGLALDTATGAWIATASPGGLDRFELLLAALADPSPRAPHLLPPGLPESAWSRTPRGLDLGSWCLDLAACSGLAVSLAGDCDPAAPAPAGSPDTLAAATAILAANGLSVAVHHGCICIGQAEPTDRLHPAERATIAVLPIGHLCRDEAEDALLATQLGNRVARWAWDMPGWIMAPLPWRRSLLVVADPPTIHQVMTALESADLVGLDAWLR